MPDRSTHSDNVQLSQDLAFVELALTDLKEYLLSDLVFWPLIPSVGEENTASQTTQTRLTLGNLLLVLKRLKSRIRDGSLDNHEEIKVAALEVQLGVLRRSWQTNWEQKALQEFTARLNQWHQYVEELIEDEAGGAAYYATEVRVRAIMDLLLTHLPNGEAQEGMAQLEELDKSLLAYFQVGGFVWESEIQKGFPEGRYWYLYGKPSGK